MATIALIGEIVTTTGTIIVAVAEDAVVPSAIDVAVIFTCAGVGMVSGAV